MTSGVSDRSWSCKSLLILFSLRMGSTRIAHTMLWRPQLRKKSAFSLLPHAKFGGFLAGTFSRSRNWKGILWIQGHIETRWRPLGKLGPTCLKKRSFLLRRRQLVWRSSGTNWPTHHLLLQIPKAPKHRLWRIRLAEIHASSSLLGACSWMRLSLIDILCGSFLHALRTATWLVFFKQFVSAPGTPRSFHLLFVGSGSSGQESLFWMSGAARLSNNQWLTRPNY